jgi:hypothetical protein
MLKQNNAYGLREAKKWALKIIIGTILLVIGIVVTF